MIETTTRRWQRQRRRKRITPSLAENDLWLVLNKKHRPAAAAAPTAAAAAPMSPPPPPPSFLTIQSPPPLPSTSFGFSPSTPPLPQPLPSTSFAFSPSTPPPSTMQSPLPPPLPSTSFAFSLSTPLPSPTSPPSSPSYSPSNTPPIMCTCEYYCENTSTTPSMNIMSPEVANIMFTEAITHHIVYISHHTPLTVAEATVNVCAEACARLLSEETQTFLIQQVACFNPWML